MHPGQIRVRSRNKLVSLGLVAVALSPSVGRADEPGIFGRIFRGASSPSTAKPNIPAPAGPSLTYGRSPNGPSPSESRFDGVPPQSLSNGAVPDAITTPQPEVLGDQGALPKLTPKSRVNRPITNAEPILARFALGRSNDGGQFAMFLEVFADGTVLDSEGVHHVRQADLQPILEAIQGSDFSKIRGHSGAPPTDFIDYVQIIVFDRRLGRLTAHPFSYSGNPQGGDHAIRHLHTALEGLQLKLSHPNPPASGAIGGAAAPASTPNQAAQPVAPISAAGPASNAVPNSVSPGPASASRSAPLAMPPLPDPSVTRSNAQAGLTTPPVSSRATAR